MSDEEDFLGISREGWREIGTAWLTGAAYSIAVGVTLGAALWIAL
jgi:hypothetical protein